MRDCNFKFILALLIIFLSTGLLSCVSKATHQQQLEKNAYLESVIKSLKNDYAQLLDMYRISNKMNTDLNQQITEEVEKKKNAQFNLLLTQADLEEANSTVPELRQTIQQLENEKQEQLTKVQGTYAELVTNLEQEILNGEVKISELEGKLTVNVVDKILFDSGKADLKQAGIKVLTRIGDILKTAADKNIQIEGHTDNIPISPTLKDLYPSNWELSTARATTVLHFLQNKVGISGKRLSAVGYGQYQPVASNNTAKGRSQNRRIQIVLTAARHE